MAQGMRGDLLREACRSRVSCYEVLDVARRLVAIVFRSRSACPRPAPILFAVPTRCSRWRRSRVNIRCGHAIRRPRFCRCVANWASVSYPGVCWAGFPDRQGRSQADVRKVGCALRRVSRPRRWRQTRRSWTSSLALLMPRVRHRRRSHLPGCWRRTRGSCPFPGRASFTVWRKIWRPWKSR